MCPAKGRPLDHIAAVLRIMRKGRAEEDLRPMNIRTGLFLAGAALALVAPPVAAQNNVNSSNCVRNNQINNWKAFSDKLVMIESYNHRKVLLRLIGTCQNLAFKNTLAVRSVGGTGLSCVSVGDEVYARSGFG